MAPILQTQKELGIPKPSISRAAMKFEMVTIIPTHGRPDLLGRTLRSLSECTFPSIYKETLVVENGPPSGALDITRCAPSSARARYLHVPIANKSAALNEAIRRAGGCLIFFTDDDVRFSPETISAYAQAASEHGTGTFFGGPTDVDYETAPPEWLLQFLPASAKGWRWDGESPYLGQPHFLGCNWAAFADDIQGLGGFDPDRGPGAKSGSTGQESDMQARLMAAGIRANYVCQSRVWHYVPRDRCSPQWTLDRAYRHGIQAGLMAQVSCPTLWGRPPWLLWRNLTTALRMLTSCFAGATTRFAAQQRRAYNRGVYQGLRARKTQVASALDPVAKPAS